MQKAAGRKPSAAFPFGGDSNIFERLVEKLLCPQGAEPPRKATRRSLAGCLGVFRGQGLIRHGSAHPGSNHRESLLIVGRH